MTEQSPTTALSVPAAPRSTEFAVGRLLPQSMKELHWLATQVGQSGFWLKSLPDGKTTPMNTAETLMVMTLGMEMGLTPLQAMENIYLMEDRQGRKTRIPRADLLAARILADPRTEYFMIDDAMRGRVTITAKRRDRREVHEVTLSLDDISMRDRQKWERGHLDDQEMLVNRTIRKTVRRHFKDMVLGLGLPDVSDDERQVIDVDAVEVAAKVPVSDAYGTCPQCGAGRLRLIANPRGGGFLACNADCGYTASPPPAVRDVMRGHLEGGAIYQQNGAEGDDTHHDGPMHDEPDPPGPALGVHQGALPPQALPPPPPPEVLEATAKEVMPTAAVPPVQPDETQPPPAPFLPAGGGTLSAVERELQEQSTRLSAQREHDQREGQIAVQRARIGAEMRKLTTQKEREAAMRALGWPDDGRTWVAWIQSLSLERATEIAAFVCMDPNPPLPMED